MYFADRGAYAPDATCIATPRNIETLDKTFLRLCHFISELHVQYIKYFILQLKYLLNWYDSADECCAFASPLRLILPYLLHGTRSTSSVFEQCCSC